MKASIKNPIPICEDNIVDKIGENSEDGGVKIGVKTAKSINKNLLKLFLANFKSFTTNYGSGFLTPKFRLAFANLKYVFLKAQL